MAPTSFTDAFVATVDITLRGMRSHELHGTHQFYTRLGQWGTPAYFPICPPPQAAPRRLRHSLPENAATSWATVGLALTAEPVNR
jgi:hypothetical protein